MIAWRYEISLRVQTRYLTREHSERVRYRVEHTRKEMSYFQATMHYSIYIYKLNEEQGKIKASGVSEKVY